MPLQFASLFDGREVFVWSDCLLDLGTYFLVFGEDSKPEILCRIALTTAALTRFKPAKILMRSLVTYLPVCL